MPTRSHRSPHQANLDQVSHAYQQFPTRAFEDLHRQADKRMGTTRDSVMRTASANPIAQWLKIIPRCQNRHHLATSAHDLPQPSRTVKEAGSSSLSGGESVAEGEVLVSKFCDQDGVICTRDRQFTPEVKSTVHRISKKTGKEPGMSNAKPEFTDGIRANLHRVIKSQRFSQRIPTIFGVVPYITHPSLVVEGKKQQRQYHQTRRVKRSEAVPRLCGQDGLFNRQGVKKGQERAQGEEKEEEDEKMIYETYNTNQMSTHLLPDTEHVPTLSSTATPHLESGPRRSRGRDS
ncbi:MAG: hypothetical protein Q9188_002560 [Gyalolechia gomerana]